MAKNHTNRSSLQKQLATIRDPNTNRVRSASAWKHKDSFIFTTKEAAELDLASIFEIGLDGFNGLIYLEPKIKAFEATLFSSAIKDVDRVLLTETENAKLNASIELFLVMISPYFLISHTGKALEWLIRRFRINEFNVDALLRCILPYHDSPLFSKMLSLLQLSADSHWSPFIGIRKQKDGVNREQIIKILIKDSNVVKFILNSAIVFSKNAPNYSTFFSFYTCSLLGYLKEVTKIDESLLSLILPKVFEGLKNSCNELRLASIMIFMELSSKTSFTKSVIDNFINLLLDNEFDQNVRITFLVQLVHSHPTCFDYNLKHQKLLLWLIEQKDIHKILRTIGEEYYIDAFYKYITFGLIREISIEDPSLDKITHLIKKLIGLSNIISQNVIIELITFMFNKILSNKKESEIYGKLFNYLDEKNSNQVQNVISKELNLLYKKSGKNSKEYKLAYNFFEVHFNNSTSMPIKETNTSLELSLNHEHREYRIVALKHLKTLLPQQDVSKYSSSYSTLVDNLKDNNLELIKTTLELFKDQPKLVKSIGPKRIWNNIKCLPDDLKWIGFEIVLTNEFIKDNLDECILYLIEGLILDGNNRQFAEFIDSKLNQNICKLSPFLNKFNIKDYKYEDNINSILIEHNQKYINQVVNNIVNSNNVIIFINQCITMANQHNNKLIQQVLIIIATLSLKQIYNKITYFEIESLINNLYNYIQNMILFIGSNIESERMLTLNDTIKSIINEGLYDKEKLNLNTISFCINQLFEIIPKGSNKLKWINLNEEKEDKIKLSALLIYKSFQLLSLKPLPTFSKTFSHFAITFLKYNIKEFICYIIIDTTLEPIVKARALLLLSYSINSNTKLDYQILLPFVLISLNDTADIIRQSGLICLNSLLNVYSNNKLNKSLSVFGQKDFYITADNNKFIKLLSIKSLNNLIQQILNNEKEILSNQNTIQSILNNIITSDKELNKSFINFIISHIELSNNNNIQILLLNLISKVESKSKLKSLSLLISLTLKKFYEEKDTTINQNLDIILIEKLLDLFTPASLHELDLKSDRYIKLLTFGLNLTKPISNKISICEIIMKRINNELFNSLSVTSQTLLIKSLIIINNSEDENLSTISKKVLLSLPVTSESANQILSTINLSILELDLNPTKKVKVNNNNNNNNNNNTKLNSLIGPFNQLTCLLEVLDNYFDKIDYSNLISILFNLISNIINLPSELTNNNINYINQLLLSSLESIFNFIKLNNIKLVNENLIRTDLVIQLLRLSNSPQVHHQALLLIASIASVLPDSVLLHVMPIFTFMGANVLQKDDNYSFYIIQQTLEKIIPPLLNNNNTDLIIEEDNENEFNFELIFKAKPIIKVFINALLFIPQHRRINLFYNLVNIMGNDLLYLILSNILEIYSIKYCDGLREEANKLKEFCIELCNQFPIIIQLNNMNKLLKSIINLPNEKEENKDYSNIKNLFDIKENNDKQLRHYKFSILNFIKQNLNNKSFLYQLIEIDNLNNEYNYLDQNYISLSESLLLIVDDLRNYYNLYSLKQQQQNNNNTKKFFKSFIAFVYDVLNDTINLLSYPCLTAFLKKLLTHSSSTIRYRSMKLLESKLEGISSQLSLIEVKSFLELVPILVNLISTNQENELNHQLCLNCLGQFIKCFSHHHKHSEEIFFNINVMPLLLSENGLKSNSLNIFGTSCIVLSYICQELNSIIIEHIPIILPTLLNQMEHSLKMDKQSDYSTVWMAQFILLEALMSKVAKLTGPYLENILNLLIQFKVLLNSDSNELVLSDKIRLLFESIYNQIEPRIILPIFFKLYNPLIETNIEYVVVLLELISKVMISLSSDEVDKLYILLFKFYLECFELRSTHEGLSLEKIESIEKVLLNGFIILVMKLTDDKFKPIFLKLGEWACLELVNNTKHNLNRMITFYHLIYLLLSQLKHIFSPYFIYTLDHAIETLDSFNSINQNNLLWKFIINSITLALQYDIEGIWSGDSYNKLVSKLMNQMDKIEDFNLANQYLIPCLDHLCNAVQAQSNWKLLNNNVLTKLKSNNTIVKCIALNTLKAFYLRQATNFLPFLPETIPSLAEVMEDDNEQVIQSFRELVITVERFSGESLDQYFK